MQEESKSEEDNDEGESDILGEFAKQYEAGVYLEEKAEGYRRKGTQPTIDEEEDEERSDVEDIEDDAAEEEE